jgi:F-type H+-transporting ATPase subunit b
MPQIDTLTFASQLFWLLICFLTFYGLVITIVLPKLARILKVRSKKINLSSNSSRNQDEVRLIISNYDSLLLSTRLKARESAYKSDQISKIKIDEDLKTIFSVNLASQTKDCLNASANLIAKKRILYKLIKSKD